MSHSTNDDASPSNGWTLSGEEELKELVERTQGWYWLHVQSMIWYSRWERLFTIITALLPLIAAVLENNDDSVPKSVMISMNLLVTILVTLRANLNLGVKAATHKTAASKLGNIKWRLNVQLTTKRQSHRDPFKDLFQEITTEYQAAISIGVESIPTRYKTEYRNSAHVRWYPEIIVPMGRDFDETQTRFHDVQTAVAPRTVIRPATSPTLTAIAAADAEVQGMRRPAPEEGTMVVLGRDV